MRRNRVPTWAGLRTHLADNFGVEQSALRYHEQTGAMVAGIANWAQAPISNTYNHFANRYTAANVAGNRQGVMGYFDAARMRSSATVDLALLATGVGGAARSGVSFAARGLSTIGRTASVAPSSRLAQMGAVGDLSASPATLSRGVHRGDLPPSNAINVANTVEPAIIGPHIVLGSKEALAAQRVYRQALNSQEPLVIGRLEDTAAGAQLGMRRLNDPDWTINVNDAWVQGGIDAQKPFYLGSNVSISNLRSGNPLYPKTVFFRELQQVRDAGYYRQGDWMLPPTKPQGF